MTQRRLRALPLFLLLVFPLPILVASELHIGAATVEGTPARAGAAKHKKDPKALPHYVWNQQVVDLATGLEDGSIEKDLLTELHFLRLGDVAIASNRFELFSDYGAQMKARSPAVQTFLIQLAGPGGYLPTARAVAGGGYSAIIQSNPVGPEGGQLLVEHSVASWKTMWDEP